VFICESFGFFPVIIIPLLHHIHSRVIWGMNQKDILSHSDKSISRQFRWWMISSVKRVHAKQNVNKYISFQLSFSNSLFILIAFFVSENNI
jgi:hypothetical protein